MAGPQIQLLAPQIKKSRAWSSEPQDSCSLPVGFAYLDGAQQVAAALLDTHHAWVVGKRAEHLVADFHVGAHRVVVEHQVDLGEGLENGLVVLDQLGLRRQCIVGWGDEEVVVAGIDGLPDLLQHLAGAGAVGAGDQQGAVANHFLTVASTWRRSGLVRA